MRPVVTADEMRALDRATIDELGIPALTLMETAGRAVADAAVAMLAAAPGAAAGLGGAGWPGAGAAMGGAAAGGAAAGGMVGGGSTGGGAGASGAPTGGMGATGAVGGSAIGGGAGAGGWSGGGATASGAMDGSTETGGGTHAGSGPLGGGGAMAGGAMVGSTGTGGGALGGGAVGGGALGGGPRAGGPGAGAGRGGGARAGGPGAGAGTGSGAVAGAVGGAWMGSSDGRAWPGGAAVGGAGVACVAVVCGPGNNGGDGFVAARVLRHRGVDATVYLAVGRDKIRGDAAEHLMILERAGGVVRAIETAAQLAEHREAIAGAAVAIDALFGVGLARPIKGHLADVVAAINEAPRRLAVDIPSGLDTDTGKVLGAAVDAHVTVAMAARKVALVGAPGFARAGEVIVAEIGIPPALIAQTARAGLVEASDVARALPQTRPLDHKGTRGHVLVVGGTRGMRGAGRLAAAAALRAGAGLCTLASDGDFDAEDSVMTRALDGEHALAKALDGKAAVAIGPGLGRSVDAAAWVAEVLASGVPAVVDADALNLYAGKLEALAAAAGPLVLTPHPGEAARLLGIDTREVEADRLAAARALAAQTRAVVVLKGARTIVCDGTLGDDHCAINPTGGPALGTGGSGDVLAGTIAALLAQKLSPGDAARVGAWIHGAAGDALAAVHGERGVVSSDLPLAIAHALARFGSAPSRAR